MKSLKLKVVIIYLALVFIVMLLCGTFMIASIRSQEIDKVQSNLTAYSTFIQSQIIQTRSDGEFQSEFIQLMKMFGEGSIYKGFEGNILDEKGIVVATTNVSSSDDIAGLIVNNRKSVVISAMAGEAGYSVSRWGFDINSLDKERIEYACPVFDNSTDAVKYIIYVSSPLDQIQIRLSEVANTIVIAVVLALILTGVLGVLFANTVTGPIILLTKKSRDLALGKLHEKIEVKSRDEIGQLTESFNDMSSELNKTLETMAAEKNKQEILLHNMTDGVLAYDKNGVLIHANYSSSELLNITNFNNIPFHEMAARLGSETTDLAAFGIDSLKEATTAIGDKYISSLFTPYFTTHSELDGIVIVLQDITRHKKLDNMRKEFVANVSHEIRTPLTTIKSYTETLLDGAIKDKKIGMEFLGIIDKEADRMALLVKDLLELSRFDNKQFDLDISEVNLNELIAVSIRQIKLLAEKKNQIIEYTAPAYPSIIMADSDRINQVLINIIGNSIKYSPEGAEIAVSIEKSERYYRVYIRDNGMGIPKEDLRRIFERFYRVDKARSRAMGGTGLGLSIAKEIIEAHGGRISANSEIGRGTTMILRFPVDKGLSAVGS